MLDDNPLGNMKADFLLKQFGDYGYTETTKISQSELLLFLNRKSTTGKFDENLCQKLFEFLNINEYSTLTIEEFVSGALQFESQYANNVDMIKSQLFQQQNIYNDLLEQCQKYENEKINENGFCESAKFYGEIVNVQLTNYLEGTEDIILTLYYNGQQKEMRQKYSSNGNVVFNTPFEFNAVSKKENVKFHLQGDTGYGYIYELGEKTYALSEINNQEEFYVKVGIPEIKVFGQVEQKIIAEITAKICMIWSNLEIYEEKRKIEEPKLNQLRIELEEAEEELKRVDKIFYEKIQNQNISNSSIREKKKGKNIFQSKSNRNNQKFEFTGTKYVVNFNFVRAGNNKNIDNKSQGMKVDFKENANFEKMDKSFGTNKLENSNIENGLKDGENNFNDKMEKSFHTINLGQNNVENGQKEDNALDKKTEKSFHTINLEQNNEGNELKDEANNNIIEFNQNMNNMNFTQNENLGNNFQSIKQNENMSNMNFPQNENPENNFPNSQLKESMEGQIPKGQDQEFEKRNNEMSNFQNMNENVGLTVNNLQNINENEGLTVNNLQIKNENEGLTDNNLHLSNISHNSNRIQNSNMIQNSNVIQNVDMLKQSNALQNPNIPEKVNEIQNSNMLERSHISQKSNASYHCNNLGGTNLMQNPEILQNQSISNQLNDAKNPIQNSNMLQQTNAVQNSNILQQPTLMQNSKMIQQPNPMQNSNMLQQTNVVQNSNMLQQSNRMQNSNMLQQPDIIQNSNMLQQTNLIQNSNMPLQSNTMKNSNVFPNSKRNSNISQNLIIIQKSNAIQGSTNIRQNSNLLQKSNAIQGPNIIQNSNMSQKSNVIQGNSYQNNNISQNSNVQGNTVQNSNMLQNSNTQGNAMQNSNMLQKSNAIQSNNLQNTNMQQNPNIIQTNSLHNSNMLQKSNEIQGNSSKNSNQPQNINAISGLNEVQNSKMLKLSNLIPSRTLKNTIMLNGENTNEDNAVQKSNIQKKSNDSQNQLNSKNQVQAQNSNMLQKSNISHYSNVNQNNTFSSQQNIFPQQINAPTYNYPIGVTNIQMENTNNANAGQNSIVFQKPIINQSTTQTVTQTNILPIQYLPEIRKEPIFENNVNTLPLITSNNTLGIAQDQYNQYTTIMPNDSQNNTFSFNLQKI